MKMLSAILAFQVVAGVVLYFGAEHGGALGALVALLALLGAAMICWLGTLFAWAFAEHLRGR